MREAFAQDAVLDMLFVAEPELEAVVRDRIVAALSTGRFDGPGDATTQWRLHGCQAGAVSDEEVEHAQRLKRS